MPRKGSKPPQRTVYMSRERMEQIRSAVASKRYTMKAIAKDIDARIERVYDFAAGRVIRPRETFLRKLDDWLKNPGGIFK